MNKKVILLILDGWGLSSSLSGNALKLANPENFNYLWSVYPHWVLNTQKYGTSNSIIDSDLGSATISTGKFLASYQEFIDAKIKDRSFFTNRAINESIKNCLSHQSSLHLVGLLSDNGTYSHINHLIALIQLSKNEGIKDLYVHVILDRDGDESGSAYRYINQIQKIMDQEKIGKIATITGRSFCFDQDAKFEEIMTCFRAIAQGVGQASLDPKQAITENRSKNRSDADLPPTVIFEKSRPIGQIKDFDNIIFTNFDDKSLKSLSSIFIGQRHAIKNKEVYNVNVVTLVDYFHMNENYGFEVAFFRDDFRPNLSTIIAENKKSQLFISEQYKSQSAIYSFCGHKNNLLGQVNLIITTPDGSKLSTDKIFTELSRMVNQNKFDFISVNFSGADYFGHRGNLKQILESINNIDQYLCMIEKLALLNGYSLLITADHGFLEQITTGQNNQDSFKTHSRNPVPLILIEQGGEKMVYNLNINNNLLTEILNAKATVCDIAPTVLSLIGIDKPIEMTGKSLIDKGEE